MATAQPIRKPPTPPVAHLGTAPESFAFILLDNFTLIAFAGAIEPLRVANRMAGRTLYSWCVLTETGAPARASNGVVVQADGPLGDIGRETTVVVVGGLGVKRAITRPLLTWLRRAARRGAAMAALCTGAEVIAKAGLLDGRRCTIHWENRASFEEDHPEIELTQTIYVIDQNRYTAAGGTASADLMLNLIARRHGSDIANLVADQLIHTAIRSDRDEQRLSIPTRIGVRHPRLATVIHRMEAGIEEPVSPAVLAGDVGISTRQLERLFRRYLGRSPKRYYMELRLQKARSLLQQTDMSVINVALACGFASPSHFSKCYRALYKTTPYRERGAEAQA
jgi:transcriptional regulator GlxA family with amidase domain